jgi:O-antigen/teichoic acid export membrane protein
VSRASRSISNFVTGTGYTVFSLVVGLVATPLLVKWLGDTRFGIWRSLSDFGGYVGLLELGLSSALMPMLAGAISGQDQSRLSPTLSEGFLAYRKVFWWMLGGYVALAALSPILVRSPPALFGEVWIAASIGIVGIAGILFSPMRVLLDSAQRGYILQLTLIGQFVTITGLSLLLARAGWGVIGLSVALLAGTAVYNIALFISARRFFPQVVTHFVRPTPDPESREQLWQLNRTALVIGICGRAALLSDSIIITQFLGPSVVTGFVLTQRLLDILRGQLQQLGNASWAALAQLHSQGQNELMQKRLIEMTRLTCVLAFAGLIPIVAYNRFFIQRWIGPNIYLGDALTILSSFSAIAWAVCSLWGWLFTGTGRLPLLVSMSIVTSVVNVTLSIGLTWYMRHFSTEYASCGPVAGTVIAICFIQLSWQAILLRREFGFSLRSLAGAIAVPLMFALPFSTGIWWVAHLARPWASTGFAPDAPGILGWISLGTEMSLVALLFLGFSWIALLSKDDRANWKLRFMLIYRRFKPAAK